MEKRTKLNPTEMKLLDYLGRCPECTNKELAQAIEVKNPPYVSTLKKTLEEKQYFVGPYYQTDYGKIFKNRIRKTIAIVLFEHSFQFMLSLLKNIECFSFLYPIEERFFRSYMVGIFDSNTEKIKEIFDYLQEKRVIFHYDLYLQNYRTYVVSPRFLLNSHKAPFVPPLDNLLEDTDIPDLSFGTFSGLTLEPPEQVLISYYELGTSLLTEIMKKEQSKGNFHTYATWKAANKRLQDDEIVRPVYDIFPLPFVNCSHSFLLVRAHNLEDTIRIVLNFGNHARLRKKIFLWTSHATGKTYGVIYCISHPEFTIKLLMELDMYEKIVDKKFFVVRKTLNLWEGKSISMDHYDPDMGTLEYPYDLYLEKIKAFLEDHAW
ncbi:MAG: hypothetical protein PVF58_02900 [Candidatus Methanofastidiosia archaeon]|jgi:hypothetical protein